MPDVRLSGAFHGRNAGEIVELTDEQMLEALDAQVVGKVYPAPVSTVSRSTARRGLAEKKAPARKAAVKKAAAKSSRERPAPPSFGDGNPAE